MLSQFNYWNWLVPAVRTIPLATTAAILFTTVALADSSDSQQLQRQHQMIQEGLRRQQLENERQLQDGLQRQLDKQWYRNSPWNIQNREMLRRQETIRRQQENGRWQQNEAIRWQQELI